MTSTIELYTLDYMKKEKVYKALWVTEKLANDIKSRASKKGLTTIQFLQETFKRTSK